MSFNNPHIKLVTAKGKPKSEIEALFETIIRQLNEALDYLKGQEPATRLFKLWLEHFQNLLREGWMGKDPKVFLTIVHKHEEWLGQLMMRLRQQESELQKQKDLALSETRRAKELQNRLSAVEGLLQKRELELSIVQAQTTKINQTEGRILAAEKQVQSLQADNASLRVQVKSFAGLTKQVNDLEHRAFGAELALERSNAEVQRLQARLKEVSFETNVAEKLKSFLQPVKDVGEKEMEFLNRLTNTVSGLKSELADAITRLADATSGVTSKISWAPAQGAFAFVDVQPLIDERSNWLEELGARITRLGEDRENLSVKNTEIDDLVKFADGDVREQTRIERQWKSLERELATLLANEQNIREQVRKLLAYQKAVETVKAGVPVAETETATKPGKKKGPSK